MKKSLILLACLCFSISIYAQDNRALSIKFIEMVNRYQADSLFDLVHDEFLLTRTYAKLTNDKTSFLNGYLSQSKKMNASYKILKDSVLEDFVQLVLEDKSDYFAFLGVENPIWKMNILVKDQKIHMASLDTTTGYSSYLRNIKTKDAAFNAWLKLNHEGETSQSLFSKEGLLMDRLMKYASERQKKD